MAAAPANATPVGNRSPAGRKWQAPEGIGARYSRRVWQRAGMLPAFPEAGVPVVEDIDEVSDPEELDMEELEEPSEEEFLDEDEDEAQDVEEDDDLLDGSAAIPETEEDEEELAESPAGIAPSDEEDEEDDEDDVEASLDVILKERLVVEEEAEEEDDSDGDARAESGEKVLPRQPGEFVCQSCFLVKNRSQLADRKRGLCRDCV